VEARPGCGAGQQLDERPRQPCQPADPLRQPIRDVRVVPAEQLVAAFPRERDLDVLGGEARDEVRRQRRRVRKRLVESVRQCRQEQRRVGAQHELAVPRSVPLRDEPRVRELVERTLLEADRERPQPAARLRRRQRGQRRRVDASGQEHADRDVAHEVRADGVPEPRPELLREHGPGLAPQLARRRRPGEPREPDPAATLPHEQMPGRQLPGPAEDRVRRRDRVEREKTFERVEVDLAPRQRPQLRRERKPVALLAVVERLDPEPVPREHEPPPARIPDRDGEHPAQPRREPVAGLLVEVDENLRVAVRPEAMAGRLELGAQLLVVVDLAVLDDVDGAVLVRDRLVARLEVDDREPPRGQADGAVDDRALAVRATVDERRVHRREPCGVDGLGRRRDAADPAHRATVTPGRIAFGACASSSSAAATCASRASGSAATTSAGGSTSSRRGESWTPRSTQGSTSWTPPTSTVAGARASASSERCSAGGGTASCSRRSSEWTWATAPAPAARPSTSAAPSTARSAASAPIGSTFTTTTVPTASRRSRRRSARSTGSSARGRSATPAARTSTQRCSPRRRRRRRRPASSRSRTSTASSTARQRTRPCPPRAAWGSPSCPTSRSQAAS